MVRLRRRAAPLRGDLDVGAFRSCVSALCAQPRKTLRNNLRAWLEGGPASPEELLARAGLDGSRRPGALPVAAFAALCRAATELGAAPTPGPSGPAASAPGAQGVRP